MYYFLLSALLVAIDQASKFWILQNLPLHESIPFLPPLVQLTYVQNTGAAFSMLSGRTWLLSLLSLVVSIVLGVLIAKKFFSRPWGLASLALVLGGAVGNLIDRAFRGYVVDMFDLMFMKFAIFNFADICVVLGGIVAAIYYGFFYEKYDVPPPKSESQEEDTP